MTGRSRFGARQFRNTSGSSGTGSEVCRKMLEAGKKRGCGRVERRREERGREDGGTVVGRSNKAANLLGLNPQTFLRGGQPPRHHLGRFREERGRDRCQNATRYRSTDSNDAATWRIRNSNEQLPRRCRLSDIANNFPGQTWTVGFVVDSPTLRRGENSLKEPEGTS